MEFSLFPTARPTNEIPPMSWDLVRFTREQIKLEQTEESKTVKALLMLDGISISGWVWIRVPLHQGIRRAYDVDEVDTDVWFDAGRGTGRASSDLTNRSFQIDRFPLNEPRDLKYSYTIVVTSQHTEGPDVQPINHNINCLAPDLELPWRGNVLVFRHGKSAIKPLINVEEKDCTAVEWVISTVQRNSGGYRKALVKPFTQRSTLLWVAFLSLIGLVQFSHIDRRCQIYAKTLIRGRITRYVSPFFTKNIALVPSAAQKATMLSQFFQVLESTRSWVVGSVALAAASVLSDPPCPTNLNVIVTFRQFGPWVLFLVAECGFHISPYAAAGLLVFEFTHPRITSYTVVISAAREQSFGDLFFASPNTDQLVAIAAYELITPVLTNVSEQCHLKGWCPGVHRDSALPSVAVHPAYRNVPRFPGVTTLDDSTSSWGRPCGWSCPGVWRDAYGLDGFAHIKWGGMDGLDDLDEDTDPTLLHLGRGRLTFRFGAFAHLYRAVLYAAGARSPTSVLVPIRLGLDRAASPDDLDISWWILVGDGPNAVAVDLDATRLKITHWPFDSDTPLPSAFTICVAPQLDPSDDPDGEDVHPVNDLFREQSDGRMVPHHGNVLVVKHNDHQGVVDMVFADYTVADMVVKRFGKGILWKIYKESDPVTARSKKGFMSATVFRNRECCVRILRMCRFREFAALSHQNRFIRSCANEVFFWRVVHLQDAYEDAESRDLNILANEATLPTLIHVFRDELGLDDWHCDDYLERTEYWGLVSSIYTFARGPSDIANVRSLSHPPLVFLSPYDKKKNGPARLACSKVKKLCGWGCPRLWRQVAGLKGVGVYTWVSGVNPVPFENFETSVIYSFLMYSAIPPELEILFLRDADYLDVVQYSHTCHQARSVVHSLLSLRCTNLLLPYVKAEKIPFFWSALNEGHGGITGSATLWVTQSTPKWNPHDLNTVVALDRAKRIRYFLLNNGWAECSVAIRVPDVLQARGSRRLRALPLSEDSHYMNLTWIYTKPGKCTITVTETADASVFKHIAEARHTMATMLLTSSTIIALHGFECAAKISTWRAGWDCRTATHAEAARRVCLMGGTNTYFGSMVGGCKSRCPGVVRRLRGGTGVGLLAWKALHMQRPADSDQQEPATEVDEHTSDGGDVPRLVTDTISQDAYNGFMEDRYAFGWTWCHCRNDRCATFMFPRDLVATVPRAYSLASNPKANAILRTKHAVEHCTPNSGLIIVNNLQAFARLYSGLLFPTACGRPYLVPVPLDHGLTSYRTMDDLWAYTWIKTRIVGIPILPAVMPPTCVVGSTTVFNGLAWKEEYQPGCYLLVFMTSIHRIGPVNPTLVSTGGVGRPVHGDVLLMLEVSGQVVDLSLESAEFVANIFYSSWKTKTEGEPIVTYSQDFSQQELLLKCYDSGNKPARHVYGFRLPRVVGPGTQPISIAACNSTSNIASRSGGSAMNMCMHKVLKFVEMGSLMTVSAYESTSMGSCSAHSSTHIAVSVVVPARGRNRRYLAPRADAKTCLGLLALLGEDGPSTGGAGSTGCRTGTLTLLETEESSSTELAPWAVRPSVRTLNYDDQPATHDQSQPGLRRAGVPRGSYDVQAHIGASTSQRRSRSRFIIRNTHQSDLD
ncbi:hypothetical protein B0H13DRAFT_1891525 [Mycena leptocephala]|nr:hypothetical protein B0H13DRAFT_1891525 [Mycena leptocephala]